MKTTTIRLSTISLVALLAIASFPALAGSGGGTVDNLPDVLTANLGIIAQIVQTIAILMGLSLFVGGMFQLKRYGEMRTMMSSQMSIAGPVMTLLAGVSLLCTPLFMGTLLVSFWGPEGIADGAYEGDTASSWSQYIPPILIFVRLIGVYAFMKGFVMAARTGSGHAQPGTIGKVLIHIFAGILCVHIMGTIKLIESILGFDFQI
jgi:intracellular multiplication protein IcmC